jgi:hypothetical protein
MSTCSSNVVLTPTPSLPTCGVTSSERFITAPLEHLELQVVVQLRVGDRNCRLTSDHFEQLEASRFKGVELHGTPCGKKALGPRLDPMVSRGLARGIARTARSRAATRSARLVAVSANGRGVGHVAPLLRRQPQQHRLRYDEAVQQPLAPGLGHAVSAGLRPRSSRVPELRRPHALRRSDRGCRPSAQRAPPPEHARAAAAPGSGAVARLGLNQLAHHGDRPNDQAAGTDPCALDSVTVAPERSRRTSSFEGYVKSSKLGPLEPI